jgi:hypothetical protein
LFWEDLENLYELINDFSDWFVWKNLWNIDYNEMAMFLDEYVYDHEDHLVLQMSYRNKNIYEVFSKHYFIYYIHQKIEQTFV